MKKYLIVLLFLFIALPASAYDFGSKEYQVETAYLGILNRHPRIDEVQFLVVIFLTKPS